MATVNNQVQYTLSLQDMLTGKLHTADAKANELEHSLGEVSHMAKEVGMALGLAFGIEKIVEFGKEVLNITAEFEGFTNVIKYSSLNSIDGAENIDYLKNAITRLHLPMKEAYEGFSEMQAGLIGTGIEGDKLRGLFEGISTAATVLHMPTQNLQRTLYDLKEIGEIGLNARIARSLSTALPGVNEIIKETFHKTFKQLEDEGVNGAVFLEKLSDGLQKHFAPGLENAGHSLVAQMNDAQTAVTQKMLELGEQLRPIFIDLMGLIKETLDSGPVQFFIEHIEGIVKTVGKAVEIWTIYKGILFTSNFIAKTFSITESGLLIQISGLTIATDGLTIATEGLGAAMSTVGLFALAAGIAFLINKLVEANEKIEETTDKLSHFKEISDSFKQTSQVYDELNLTWHNINKLNDDEKTTFLGRLTNESKKLQEDLDLKLIPALDDAKKHLEEYQKKAPVKMKGETDIEFAGRKDRYWAEQMPLEKKVKEDEDKISKSIGSVKVWTERANALQKSGIKLKTGPTVINSTQETKTATGHKSTNINIKIGDLVKELNIHSTTIQGGAKQLRDMVTEVLTSAIMDSQHIAHD